MKRLNSSDSLGDLISIRLPTEDCNQETSGVYGRDYYDEEGCVDESGQKKRRLSVVQVKALEKDFNVENKLEPDRKAKLAHELGLQPRQVAVWFQNRRARWKTKQLERDYGVLNANFDALKSNYDSVQQENEALVKEIGELKSKLQESSASTTSVKEELPISESEDQVTEYASTNRHSISSPSESDQPKTNELYNTYNNRVSIIKDRGASSDSSTILNNEESSSPNAANSSSSLLHFTEANGTNSYLPQFVKIEEHNFFSGDEACNFFLDDQVPSLQWYCTDQWS